ncbi:hypothetical protein D3877_11825 [Azospirillum cavernae]|uniref:Uncharacterized protein n=1 Tax=Azospirillum cavernae TaxID=2320860 RepID=A0A418VUT5_9PROT|nr:hypothetical protein [Azospirillum cavernae]RJF80918.1 hypothetical protein D3877_11825 [Azospirillum cavernae]
MDARREEDALDLRRLRSSIGAVIGEAVDVAGQDGRLFPALKPSIAALRDAVADLESDIDGLLADIDPDAEFESPTRRAPTAAE